MNNYYVKAFNGATITEVETAINSFMHEESQKNCLLMNITMSCTTDDVYAILTYKEL